MNTTAKSIYTSSSSEKEFIIYRHVWPTTGHYYYGKTSYEKWKKGYVGSGVLVKEFIKENGSPVRYLYKRDMNEDRSLGAEETIVTPDMLKDPLCLNRLVGGGWPVSGDNHPLWGKKHSEETKKKMSESAKGRKPWNTDKPLSDDHKKKISKSTKGKNNPNWGNKHSEETRRKISKNNARYWQDKERSEETKRKIAESHKGYKHTNEAKKKMSDAKKGTNLSAETKRKISITMKNKFL